MDGWMDLLAHWSSQVSRCTHTKSDRGDRLTLNFQCKLSTVRDQGDSGGVTQTEKLREQMSNTTQQCATANRADLDPKYPPVFPPDKPACITDRTSQRQRSIIGHPVTGLGVMAAFMSSVDLPGWTHLCCSRKAPPPSKPRPFKATPPSKNPAPHDGATSASKWL